jgi:hypothetical protein
MMRLLSAEAKVPLNTCATATLQRRGLGQAGRRMGELAERRCSSTTRPTSR